MAAGTKTPFGTLRGVVINRSRRPVWALVDDTGDGKTTYAKIVHPGHCSPSGVDVDAVGSFSSGETISGWAEWWKFSDHLWATVRSHPYPYEGLYVGTTPIPGGLTKTLSSDWGDIAYDEADQNWGVKLL